MFEIDMKILLMLIHDWRLIEFHSEPEETDVFEERSVLLWSDV